MAVLNDIEIDVKTLCVQNRTTQEQIAKAVGTTGQYVNRVIHKEDGLINRHFHQHHGSSWLRHQTDLCSTRTVIGGEPHESGLCAGEHR